jgi:hypothetical protein
MKKQLLLKTLLVAAILLLGGTNSVWATDYNWTFDAYCTAHSIAHGDNDAYGELPSSASTVISSDNSVDLTFTSASGNTASRIYDPKTNGTVGGQSYSSYFYMGGNGSTTDRILTTGTITGLGKLTIVYKDINAAGTCDIYNGSTKVASITPTASTAMESSTINLGEGASLKIVHTGKVNIWAVKWTAVSSYNVTYKANGGTGSDIVDDEATTVAANTFTKTNCTFVEWNTAADGSGTSYAVGATVTSDLTLYAQWSETIYSKSLSGWAASDVTTTEGTLNKWYNSYGMAAADYYNGMYIESTYGLHVGARDNSSVVTTTLTLDRTENSIISIDAVWNTGYKSADSNTPYSQFSYGDFTVKQVLDTRSGYHKTTYTINGNITDLGEVLAENNVDIDIHLVVNSYTGVITEFYLKKGETYLAQFSDLTETNNHFSASANYDAVTMGVYMKGSKANAWTAMKSITVSEQEQAVYSYTVKGKTGGTTLKTLATGDNLPGSTIYYHYNQVLNNNGTLYKAASDNSGYKSSFTLNSNNQEVVKAYSQPASPITNLVFLAEGEDIFTRGTGSSADTRCSMGAGGYASSKTAFVTLPAGTYYLVLTNRCSAARTGIHKFYKGDDADPFFSADGIGYNQERASGEFTLTGTTTLYMQGGDANQYVDWLYIYGTFADEADATCLIENPDMETAGSGSGMQEVVKGWSNCSVVTNYRRLANSGLTNPSGAFTNTYSFENWTDIAGGLVGQMSQTISGIPNGVYKLQLAALVNSVNGQFIYGKSNGKTYKTSIAGDANVANDYSVIVVVEDNQLEIGLDMNGSGATWAAIDNARLTYTPDDATVSKTISAAGWATYCSPYALDLENATGLADAFIITGGADNVLAKTSVKGGTVPANTGLLIKGDEGTATIPVVASSATNVSANKLEGVTSNTNIAANAGYVLMNDATNGLGFYKNTNAFTVGANTAYLPANFDTTGARFFSLFDDATAIEAVKTQNFENGQFFNLAGQRVAQPQKGLYIVNGKKVIIK